MTGKIVISDENFQTAIEEMGRAIEAFKPYSSKFMEQTQTNLSDMQSDFIEEMIEVLDNMCDTKAPELLESMNQYQKNIKFVYTSYVEKDERTANELSGGKS